MKPYLFLVPLLALTACASTPEAGTARRAAFDKPATVVQDAATHALSQTGFEIEKSEPGYLQGFRPHKLGFFVGSGGETIGVWIESDGATRTNVKVDTARSFVGIVGQKEWNDDVIAAMRKELETP